MIKSLFLYNISQKFETQIKKIKKIIKRCNKKWLQKEEKLQKNHLQEEVQERRLQEEDHLQEEDKFFNAFKALFFFIFILIKK